jgi:CRP/FNR family transcriptional regulator, dissimilatory nitrate respiration regulator
MSCSTQAIMRGLPAFDMLCDATIQRLAGAAHLQKLAKGATVFLQGDKATCIRFVCEGWVKLYRISGCGSEAVIRLMPRDHSLEEMAALCGANHDLSAQAVSDVQVLAINAAAVRNVMADDPCLSVALIDMAARNMGRIVTDVEQLKIRTGAQRLAAFLLELAPRGNGRVDFQLPYDKHMVASLLGLAPESLSRSFCRLRAVGVTLERSAIRIADVERLADFALEDQATVRARA